MVQEPGSEVRSNSVALVEDDFRPECKDPAFSTGELIEDVERSRAGNQIQACSRWHRRRFVEDSTEAVVGKIGLRNTRRSEARTSVVHV